MRIEDDGSLPAGAFVVSPKFYEDTNGNLLMEICEPLPLL